MFFDTKHAHINGKRKHMMLASLFIQTEFWILLDIRDSVYSY